MRNAEERAQLKSHFFKLGQGRVIPMSDVKYWSTFWRDPEAASDIYDLLTPDDIKSVRDQNKVNYVIFVRALCEKIVAMPNQEFKPVHLLNCVRWLTKVLPFLFELPDYIAIENELFWSSSFDPIKLVRATDTQTEPSAESCLAIQFMRSLIGLLFTRTFSVAGPESQSGTRHFVLWEPGIGSTSKYLLPDLTFDANRAEVLKLVITLVSTSFYQTPSQIISEGSKFLTLLVAATPRTELLALVCSLTNLVCRSARSNPNENVLCYANSPQLTEVRHLLATLSIQLLTSMIAYPLPSSDQLSFLRQFNLIPHKPCNLARLYMGKLHKDSELLFLGSSLLQILKTPFNSGETSQFSFKSVPPPSLWAIESAMLIWEMIQCNKNFKVLFAQFINEMLVSLTYYLVTYHNSPAQRSLVRICSYLMLYISAEQSWIERTLQPISPTFYDSLPSTMKLSPNPITTRDFIVTHLSNLLQNRVVESLMVTLVEIIYNLVPPISILLKGTNEQPKKLSNANPGGGLSYATCSSLTQLISKFSSRAFLQDKAVHSDLLALLIRAVCTAVVKYPAQSRMLLFSVLKNERVYTQVWDNIHSFDNEYFSGDTLKVQEEPEVVENATDDESDDGSSLSRVASRNSDTSISSDMILDKRGSNPMNVITEGIADYSDTVEDESIEEALRPKPLTGMSVDARGKLPMESSLSRSWTGNDSLRIILTIIIPHLKLVSREMWSTREGSTVDSFVLVRSIEAIDFSSVILQNKSSINFDFLPETDFNRLRFNWNHLSLGWYVSLLYGEMYNCTSNVKNFTGSNRLLHNITTSIASVGKFTSGWTSFIKPAPEAAGARNDSAQVVEYVSNSLTATNPWAGTSIRLFRIETTRSDGIFGKLGSFNQSVPVTGGVNDMASHLVKRFSDFRVNNTSRGSIGSIPTTPVEEKEMRFPNRNSVSSLHSLNTLNRTRSNTPRNSISN